MPLVLRPISEKVDLRLRLTRLGQSRRNALLCHGVFQSVALMLALVAVAGSLDFAFHLASGFRALLLLLTLGLGGVLLQRRILGPLFHTEKPLSVALLLEQRFPRLNDSLASAIEFLADSSSENRGSPRLQRIAQLRAENILERCHPEVIIPKAQAWRAFWLMAVTVGIVGTIAVLNLPKLGVLAQRLAVPFGTTTWPTKTQIRLLDPVDFPRRLTRGEPFLLNFRVTGLIPEKATLTLRVAGMPDSEEPIMLNPGSETATQVEATARIDAGRASRDFQIQLRANDAQTAWLAVTVAPPPKLVPRDGRPSPQMWLEYPDYTGLAPMTAPDGAGVIEAIAGTRIQFQAAADRPISKAYLRPQADVSNIQIAATVAILAGQSPLALPGVQELADSISRDIPVMVSGEGTMMQADFIPIIPGLYQFAFTDETGLTGTRLLDLRINPDPTPVVALDRPQPGVDALTLLPTAKLALSMRAEDRTYAIRSLFVEYRIGGPEAPWQTTSLFDVRTYQSPLGAVAGAVVIPQARPISSTAAQNLPISLFRRANGAPVADGDVVTIRAAADDWDTVSVLKEPGRSKEIELRIVSKSSLDTILQQELARLRPELLRQKEELRQTREKVEEVKNALTENKVTPSDTAKLRNAEQSQKDIRNRIMDPRNGLKTTAEQLREIIKANELPRTPTTDRVQDVAGELARLTEQNLDPVEPLLNKAKEQLDKNAAPSKPDAENIKEDLATVSKQQQAAVDGIDRLLRQLEQWGGASEVRAEARALKDQLNKANEAANRAGEKLEPGKTNQQMSASEKAAVNKAAEEFQHLADRGSSLLDKAQRLAQEKETKAKGLQAAAEAKAAEAAAAQKEASALPKGSDEANAAQAKADNLKSESDALKSQAKQAQAEANSLKDAVKQSGGQEMLNSMRLGGTQLKQNNAAQSAQARRDAMDRLDKFSDALTERPQDRGDELAKKKRDINKIDELANELDELRKKTKKANEIADPKKRSEELDKLSREQDQLKEKIEQQVERLQREKQSPETAENLRKAAEKLEAAKKDLENGMNPEQKQEEALERLDEAANKLDRERQEDQNQLSKEKRDELAEKLKLLREWLKGTDDEAARIQAEVIKAKGWDRAKLTSLRDLEERARGVAEEIRTLSEKELEPLPVYRQLADQAAVLADRAAKLFVDRKDDATDAAGATFDPVAEAIADDRTRRPLKTAIRRLDHILDSLKEDPMAAKKPDGGDPMQPMPMGGGEGGMPPMGGPQGVPPLKQIKALRSIQAEINERTAAFAKAHPDDKKLSEADQEELEELERTQREVAELFRKVGKLFQKPEAPELQ